MPVRTALLTYGGNTYEALGGRPRQRGRLYQLTTDGRLHWYGYDGDGHPSPDAPLAGWAERSGNAIAEFGPSVDALVPLGDQMLLAREDRHLYLRKYLGSGRADPAGTRPGAWTRRSLALKGLWWQGTGVAFLISTPLEGSAPFQVTKPAVIRIAPDGGWFWYRYQGPDEPSEEGGHRQYWHPDSGNQIRTYDPADHFRHIVAVGAHILTVDQEGVLRWHNYSGDGETYTERNGGPWHRNSGTVIDHGWDSYSHITGGIDWDNGGIMIFCIREDTGDLVYHRYTGHGDAARPSEFAVGPKVIGHGW